MDFTGQGRTSGWIVWVRPSPEQLAWMVDHKRRWLEARIEHVGYVLTEVSGIGAGWVDPVTRTVYWDPSGEQSTRLERLVDSMEWLEVQAISDSRVAVGQKVAGFSAAELVGWLGELVDKRPLGWLPSDDMFARATIAHLRRRMPQAFDALDDVPPWRREYLERLRTGLALELSVPGGNAPRVLAATCWESSDWLHVCEGEATPRTCVHQVYRLQAAGVHRHVLATNGLERGAAVEDGRGRLEYVRQACGERATWVTLDGKGERCTQHAARCIRNALAQTGGGSGSDAAPDDPWTTPPPWCHPGFPDEPPF